LSALFDSSALSTNGISQILIDNFFRGTANALHSNLEINKYFSEELIVAYRNRGIEETPANQSSGPLHQPK